MPVIAWLLAGLLVVVFGLGIVAALLAASCVGRRAGVEPGELPAHLRCRHLHDDGLGTEWVPGANGRAP